MVALVLLKAWLFELKILIVPKQSAINCLNLIATTMSLNRKSVKEKIAPVVRVHEISELNNGKNI